jgi:hypothetical protein
VLLVTLISGVFSMIARRRRERDIALTGMYETFL